MNRKQFVLTLGGLSCVKAGIISAPMRRTSADTNVFIGNDLESVSGVARGFLTGEPGE